MILVLRPRNEIRRRLLMPFCFGQQVHGLEGNDFVDGHVGFPDRGNQKERREIEQGLQNDQEQGPGDRSVPRLRSRIPARDRE